MTLRTRFAPSPTGQLHLGHARAAFEAFGFASRQSGTCLLRIEDIDHTRCRPDATRGIYQDLDWLGLDWPLPVRVQSAHYPDYAAVMVELVERGLVYPCTLTRRQIKEGQGVGRHQPLVFTEQDVSTWSDHSLNDIEGVNSEMLKDIVQDSSERLKPSLPFSVRLDLKNALKAMSEQSLIYTEIAENSGQTQLDARPNLEAWANSSRPDPIMARRDIGTSYDIAVTHDDALQSITHVVRGKDLFDQTPLHVLIQTLMGWPVPLYHHHDLVLREDGEKLAKRNLDTALASLREAGQSVAEVKRLAGLT